MISDNTSSFTFHSNEPGSFQCLVDENPATAPPGDWYTCSSGDLLAPLGNGPHSFAVRAVDRAGNRDSSPPQRSFTVSAPIPDTAIDSGPAEGSTISVNTPTFTFHSTPSGASFQCLDDKDPASAADSDWSTCNSGDPRPPLANGSRSFCVRAVNGSGNADPSPDCRHFTVSAPVPETHFDPHTPEPINPAGYTNDNTPTLYFSSTPAGATLQCLPVDENPATAPEGDWTACSSPHTISPALPDGPHTFSVRAKNAAGPDPSPATRSFTVDVHAPNTQITAGPTGTIHDPTPAFSFTSTESGSSFQYELDQDPATAPPSAWKPLTSSTPLPARRRRPHLLRPRRRQGRKRRSLARLARVHDPNRCGERREREALRPRLLLPTPRTTWFSPSRAIRSL